VLVFAGPAGPATQWSVVPSPTPSGGRLGAVSCANAQMCFAMGSISNGQHFSTFMERWDGKRWAMVERPTFGADSGLAGVSCPTVRFCIAVGETTQPGERSLVERWDGNRWTRQYSGAFPANPENWLTSVSCTSPTFCMAVGGIANQAQDTDDTFVARWNGRTWSLSAHQHTTEHEWLDGVSCVSPSSCMAVGPDGFDYPQYGLVDHWNGARWTRKVLPGQKYDLEFTGVSCVTTTSCLAVGTKGGFLLYAERWSTGGWHDVSPPPKVGSADTVGGVWCSTTTSCFAVGARTNVPLVEHWNGSHWAVAARPNTNGYLLGITCTGSTCFAVGTLVLRRG